jgi:hypothetical protein
MKRIHNWHKMVPTAQQIKSASRWSKLSAAALETSDMFFKLASEVKGPGLVHDLIETMNRYYKISRYCGTRSDMSLIVQDK